MVYLDNAASTRVCAPALRAAAHAMETVYANPSSPHPAGQQAKAVLETARHTVARAVGAHPAEVLFTGGGTEANNWAPRMALQAGARQGKRHWVLSAIEHVSLLNTAAALECEGFAYTLVRPDNSGVVSAAAVAAALRTDTALVSVMLANNETGALQPVRAIAALCRERGIVCHTDAIQAAGKIPVDAAALGVDMLCLSAHKFHGPKGAGALVCRRGVPLTAWLAGGGQERGMRPGTENAPGVAGMAAALEDGQGEAAQAALRAMGRLTAVLENGLLEIPGCTLIARSAPRVPGLVCAAFAGANGRHLLAKLYAKGICASSGAACGGGAALPSPVLLAMGLPAPLALSAIRFSLSRYTTGEEIEEALCAVKACAALSPL